MTPARYLLTGRLETIDRRRSSRAGNPRFAVTIGGTTLPTLVNGAVGYEVTNYRAGAIVTVMVENDHNGRGAIVDMWAGEVADR